MYAHDEGILHFHDADYFLEHIHNCCLVNLKDMLNNGTIINRKMIESPKSFRVACTVATQIVQQVANGQYGGEAITLAPLIYAPDSFLRPIIRCLSISSAIIAVSLMYSGSSFKYMKIERNGAWPMTAKCFRAWDVLTVRKS